MAEPKPIQVSCPQCGKSAPWGPANPYRPFCSERCRLIDLAEWASESYRVGASESADQTEGKD